MKLSPEMTAKVLELAGGAPAAPKAKRKRRPPAVQTVPAGPLWSVTLRAACRVVSEANRREHWAVAHRRAKAQKVAVQAAWFRSLLSEVPLPKVLPLTVTLEHVGPVMDDDNLARAFKSCRDAVAALIGVDDGDSRVRWVYRQRTGAPGVVVTIEQGAA